MKKGRLREVHRVTTWFFCLSILLQSGVESPVLCLEADGHINIEAGCDITCDGPSPMENGHQDECDDCIDIPFWSYTPDLTFLMQSYELDGAEFEIAQDIKNIEFPAVNNEIRPQKKTKHQLPLFLKSTILII
mgnify:CR=1 FL=1